MARKFITFCVLVLLKSTFFIVSGNKNSSTIYVGVRTHYGFIIPHSEKIKDISHSSPRGLELDFGWHHTSDNAWKYCFCYPRTGVMLSWFDFDNQEILGNALALTPYIEPFFSAEKSFSASVKAGLGITYLNNIYDPVSNPLNHFYSTHLSFLVFMNLNLNYRINDNLNMRFAAYYNHISNGGNKQPNKGINFPTAGLGLDYSIRTPYFPKRSRDDYHPEEKKASAIRMSVFFTTKEISKEDGKQYPVFGFSPKYSYLLGRLSAVSAGFEFASDGSIKERIKQENIEDSDHRRLSIFVGHELLIGRFNFYQELGAYLYAPRKPKDPVYQRYGLEYFIHNNLSIGTSIKSHRHVADFLDFRISYVF